MRIHLKVWRQSGPNAAGRLVDYTANDVSPDMSFLEMLDVVNEELIAKGEDPIAFDSDCREGICGTCGFLVDGVPHGPDPGTTVCQLHMRRFKDGDSLVIEPWRARAFPLIKDLVVDRSAFDRIIQAGGYTSVNVGGAQDGNAILVSKHLSDKKNAENKSHGRIQASRRSTVGDRRLVRTGRRAGSALRLHERRRHVQRRGHGARQLPRDQDRQAAALFGAG